MTGTSALIRAPASGAAPKSGLVVASRPPGAVVLRSALGGGGVAGRELAGREAPRGLRSRRRRRCARLCVFANLYVRLCSSGPRAIDGRRFDDA